MNSITYLILGLLLVFFVIIAATLKTSISTLTGIVMAGLTLACVPFIIYWMRSVNKRDRTHEE